MALSSILFLSFVVAAFVAFAVTLIGVSLHTMATPSRPEPAPASEVTPAKRAEVVRISSETGR